MQPYVSFKRKNLTLAEAIGHFLRDLPEWECEVFGAWMTDRASYAFACWLELARLITHYRGAKLRRQIAAAWHSPEPCPAGTVCEVSS